jgi:hypothetical protein
MQETNKVNDMYKLLRSAKLFDIESAAELLVAFVDEAVREGRATVNEADSEVV